MLCCVLVILAFKLNDEKFHYFNGKDELNKIFQRFLGTARLIPYDFCLVVLAIWQWITFCFCRYVSLTIVCPCSKKTIICVNNILKLLYYYWNLFYYLFCWSKHIYKVFFLLVISLTFTSFIRSSIFDGS